MTGPESNVERFLAQAKDKLNMQDAARLYKTGDEGRPLAMNLRKLENGYSLQGKPFLIHGIATALGMENAKTSLIPECISEKPQDDDDQPLTPKDARTFRTCVGKAMYLSHHRPDIQHSVNTLSGSMRNPTMIAMRRLKKLTRRAPGRMKHVELKMLAVQEWLKTGRPRVRKVSTHDNPADLMTKAMSREKLIKFGRALNLRGSLFTDLSRPAQQQ